MKHKTTTTRWAVALCVTAVFALSLVPISLSAKSVAPDEPVSHEGLSSIPLEQNISGTVKNEAGEALIGATVSAKGTTLGALTDDEGRFELSVPDEVTTLVVSYIGYTSQEIEIGGRTVINIVMAEGVSTLDEVVVVGYGTQKKANLTGAVSVITAEALENRPIASVGQGLQGLVPNLNVTIRNGDPTAAANFNIRGYESINGGSPLILVDGVPMALERINPNDIESVNVLKDASAAAVYGARAAFGVILVKTKSGKRGKVKINLSTELSAAKPIFHMDPVNDPYEFVKAKMAMQPIFVQQVSLPMMMISSLEPRPSQKVLAPPGELRMVYCATMASTTTKTRS